MPGFEVDFLPVGEGERSGDGITVRYGEPGAFTILVVDGGSQACGDEMVTHLRRHYDNPPRIDHIVLTHADDDHSSGLRNVIDSFHVGAVWMNRPWLYAAELVNSFKDARWTPQGLYQRLRQDFPILAEIEDKCVARRIPIYEALQGAQVGAFRILAPSRQRYLQLVPQFSRTPTPAQAAPAGLLGLGRALAAAKAAAQWIAESWNYETLEQNPETSASNESSVVQLADLYGRRILLTGDAGVQALTEAALYAASIGVGLPGLYLMQVPHHGSRHNVSPATLNAWIGPPVAAGQYRVTRAFASVAKADNERPRKKVVNAFTRRGAKVYATKGSGLHQREGLHERAGWSAATPIPFSDQVEA